MLSRSLISNELRRTQKLLDYAEEQLLKCPPGTLKAHKHNNRLCFSVLYPKTNSGKSTEKYIKFQDKNCPLLAQKRYYKEIIPLLKKRLALLQKASDDTPDLIDALDSLPADIAMLCSPLCVLPSGRIALWNNYQPETNPYHLERCIYETKGGELVRSKSELMIANLLNDRGLLYKYEASLTLNGKTIYPDFSVLSPIDGRLIFWEHFGMMDDPEYYRDFTDRKRLYNNSRLFEGCDLIFTFESSFLPLMPKDAQLQIDRLLEM